MPLQSGLRLARMEILDEPEKDLPLHHERIMAGKEDKPVGRRTHFAQHVSFAGIDDFAQKPALVRLPARTRHAAKDAGGCAGS